MRVMIVGVAASTGRLLAERLLTAPGGAITSVTGLDDRPCYPPLAGLRFVRARLDQPEWVPLLAETDALVLLPGVEWPPRWSQRARDVRLMADVRHVVQAAVAANVPKLVVATSAALYGPQPPGDLREDAPVRGHQAGAYARVRALAADYLDGLAQGRYNGVFTRFRTAWTCGARHLALVRHLASGPLLACGRADNALSLVHEDDLVAALTLALRRDLPGIYHVSGGTIPFREVAALVGQDQTCRSVVWLALVAWWRWRVRGQRTPPGWFRALVDAPPLNAGKLIAAGWTPQHSARAAIIEALEVLQTGN